MKILSLLILTVFLVSCTNNESAKETGDIEESTEVNTIAVGE
jgi:hypothetical protein